MVESNRAKRDVVYLVDKCYSFQVSCQFDRFARPGVIKHIGEWLGGNARCLNR